MRPNAWLLCLLVTLIFIPLVTNGDPAPFPASITLTAPGYRLVGGADLFVACAADGSLRVSGYALRPDDTQGHTVFAVDVPNAQLIERPEYRPSAVIRGSIFGQPLDRCGIGGVLSVSISNPNAGQVFMQRGN